MPIRDYLTINEENVKQRNMHDINQQASPNSHSKYEENNKENGMEVNKEDFFPMFSFQELPPNSIIDNVVSSDHSISISSDVLQLKSFCSSHQKTINNLKNL